MPERKHEERPVRLQGTPQVSRGSTGQVSPQQAGGAFSTQVASAPQIVAEGPIPQPDRMGSTLVQHLIGKLSGIMDEVVESRRQQAYLDGALAVNSGISEEELQTNPVTRAWTLAGHRDYSGRIAAAEYESRLAKELAQDRELSPQEYAKKVASMRKEIMPVIDSMTTQGKTKMLDQLLTMEMAAVRNHQKAYTDFVSEQYVGLMTMELNSGMDRLIASRGDPEQYNAELASFFTKLVRNVVESDALQQGDKATIITNVGKYALAEGDFEVYRSIMEVPAIPDGDGNLVPLSAILPMARRQELSSAKSSATNKYFASRYRNYNDALIEAETAVAFGLPLDPQLYASALSANRELELKGEISPEKARSQRGILNSAYKKAADMSASWEAWRTGDYVKLQANDVKDSEMARAFFNQTMQTAETPAEAVAILYNQYRQNGSEYLAKMTGELFSSTMDTWLRTDTPIEEMPRDLNEMLSAILDVQKTPLSDPTLNRFNNEMYNGMSDTSRAFMANVLTGIQHNNLSINDAAAQAREYADQVSTMDDSQRRAYRGRLNDYEGALLESISETQRRFPGDKFLYNVFGSEKAELRDLRIEGTWVFGDNSHLADLWAGEVSYLARNASKFIKDSKAYLPETSYRELVINEVARHVVDVDGDKLILPVQGGFTQRLGIPSSYEPKEILQEVVPELLKEAYKAEGDSPSADRFNLMRVRGETVVVQSFVRDGAQQVGTYEFSVSELRDKVEQRIDSSRRISSEMMESGVPVRDSSGNEISLFGVVGSDNVSTERAVELQNSLVQFEGVRYTVYKDGGRTAFGPGLGSGNPTVTRLYEEQMGKKMQVGDAVPREVVETIFPEVFGLMRDEVQPTIQRWNMQLQPKNPAAVEELLMHFTWQMGGYNVDSSTEVDSLMRALQFGSPEQQMQALARVPAYKSAHAERRTFYQDLVKRIK